MKKINSIVYFKNGLKTIGIAVLRIALRVFYIFPVKRNVILFSSFQGGLYSCNPKYIFEDLYAKKHDLTYVWCINKNVPELENNTDVKCVKFLSLKHIYYLMICGIYISNQSAEPFIPKRKSQIFINTWHGGGAYKRTPDKLKKQVSFMYRINLRAKMVDYFISSSRKFTEVMARDLHMPESKFLEIGMPRNDMLIHFADYANTVAELRTRLKIPSDKKIVLYAPTYRGGIHNPDSFDFSLDISNVLSSLKNRFGIEFIFLFRCHHLQLNKINVSDSILDVSFYEDMQELLLLTDVLITDYSSSIWDFSFTYRPCFLFTPDLSQYLQEQGFYTLIDSWPFPHAESNAELSEKIIVFDQEKYHVAVDRHHAELGSCELGRATESIVDFVSKKLGETK